MTTSDVYDRQGFGKRLGYGEHTALLIIDLQKGFEDETVFGGFNIRSAIAQTGVLLGAARSAGLPVAHVCFQVQEGGANLGPFGLKVPGLARMTAEAEISRIVDALAPAPGEYVATKQHASAFFGTSLAAWLLRNRIDTLLVAGCTTSGCVRASVVDASAYGLKPIVVEECVGDRAEAPHRANLFDMEQKYADVVRLSEVLDRLGADRRAAAG
ncbi:isochorismatase family protein [Enterovirga rhinocerotis]|uniref:Maleamate amidohydrolase n=1 Tax=Enterovirga rhinocerotis TaxID=1339210 RepID=A0A4R7CB66_9HYPH|nr:isochorismatase family protein [Enterovirga rhinocerotis]TDR95664.1 maleamate amidohydrolase [Enterovirga rhinocerotis]